MHIDTDQDISDPSSAWRDEQRLCIRRDNISLRSRKLVQKDASVHMLRPRRLQYMAT